LPLYPLPLFKSQHKILKSLFESGGIVLSKITDPPGTGFKALQKPTDFFINLTGLVQLIR